MADHAGFHLPIRTQPARMHNRIPYLAGFCLCSRQLHMPCPVAVASLTIDTFRQLPLVNCFCEGLVMSCRNLRIRVVAEHAVVADGPPKAVVVRTVVAGIHRPVSAL